jgi:enoyl-CoA hydratase/carnithine racemase
MSAITTERNGHVACVEVHKPPNNHVSAPLMRELADAFARLDEETWCRAIVLQSEGKNFCAGADLAAPRGLADANVSPGISDLYVEAVRLFSNKKPIVAAIQGAAVGAGLGLALVADHRVAAADARFTANFVKLGFHPGFGLTCTLPRVIGSQRASLMFLTGRRLKPQEALDWGLIDAVVPEADLRVEALKLAAEIAENAPLAVQSTRATLRAGLAEAVKAQTDVEFREQSWLRATKDFAEGVRAVAERRPGNFVGA